MAPGQAHRLAAVMCVGLTPAFIRSTPVLNTLMLGLKAWQGALKGLKACQDWMQGSRYMIPQDAQAAAAVIYAADISHLERSRALRERRPCMSSNDSG